MRVLSLGSGSKGNAYLLVEGGSALLIDCGLSGRMLASRISVAFGTQPKPSISGVLLTHSHTDHTAGLGVLLKRQNAPVYANFMTAETVMRQEGVAENRFVCFENGQEFDVGPFRIHPFSIPHDTSDPVGYLVRSGGETYFHGTDIGTPLDSVGSYLAAADVATLESNHDPQLLYASGRPQSLIQRIAGPRGHLSNDQACELVNRFASPRLKRLALAHLSRDCNAPHLAERSMRETLARLHREDVSLTVLAQDAVMEI